MIDTSRSFKALVTQWSRRANQLGQAGVGRAGESYVDQANRIEGWLEDVLPDRFYHHVLDFGCGWGRFTSFLERRGSHVWAVDVVPRWVSDVRQLSKTLTAVQLNEPALPLDGRSMDLVVDIMTLQSIDDVRLLTMFVDELRRVAAPGGNILSLHRLDDGVRAPLSIISRLGCEPNWSVVLSPEIDLAGDMYCLLLGQRSST